LATRISTSGQGSCPVSLHVAGANLRKYLALSYRQLDWDGSRITVDLDRQLYCENHQMRWDRTAAPKRCWPLQCKRRRLLLILPIRLLHILRSRLM